jgi:hypothetical protein
MLKKITLIFPRFSKVVTCHVRDGADWDRYGEIRFQYRIYLFMLVLRSSGLLLLGFSPSPLACASCQDGQLPRYLCDHPGLQCVHFLFGLYQQSRST